MSNTSNARDPSVTQLNHFQNRVIDVVRGDSIFRNALEKVGNGVPHRYRSRRPNQVHIARTGGCSFSHYWYKSLSRLESLDRIAPSQEDFGVHRGCTLKCYSGGYPLTLEACHTPAIHTIALAKQLRTRVCTAKPFKSLDKTRNYSFLLAIAVGVAGCSPMIIMFKMWRVVFLGRCTTTGTT